MMLTVGDCRPYAAVLLGKHPFPDFTRKDGTANQFYQATRLANVACRSLCTWNGICEHEVHSAYVVFRYLPSLVPPNYIAFY